MERMVFLSCVFPGRTIARLLTFAFVYNHAQSKVPVKSDLPSQKSQSLTFAFVCSIRHFRAIEPVARIVCREHQHDFTRHEGGAIVKAVVPGTATSTGGEIVSR